MALTGDGRGRGGPSPSETSGPQPENLHAPFAESPIPPKQLTQPQRSHRSSTTVLRHGSRTAPLSARRPFPMYKIQTLNAISDIIYTQLSADTYTVAKEEPVPDGILVRSAAMHDMEFGPSLEAIARAGAVP